MPDLNLGTARATAVFDSTAFRAGIQASVRDLQQLRKAAGTVTLTAKLAGNAGAQLRKEVRDLADRAIPVRIVFDAREAVRQLKADLLAVPGVNLSTIAAFQGALNVTIREARQLLAQLQSAGAGRGAGGAGGAGGPGVTAASAQMLAALDRANNAYNRGEISATEYARRLEELRTRLQSAAAAAGTGTRDFQALDNALTRLQRGLRGVQDTGIKKLRDDLAGAKAAFEGAATGATTLAAKRAAQADYVREINRTTVALQALARSGRLTSEQLGTVNRLLSQTAVEGRRVAGINFGGGLGSLTQHLSRIALFLPSVGGLSAGLVGLPPALAAAGVAASAFAAGLSDAFRTAAQFQQVMVDIKALTQTTPEEFDRIRESVAGIGQPLGVGMTAAAEATLELNRAGLTAAQTIGGGLAGALTLAGAAGIEASEAAKLSAAAMTAFGLSAAEMPKIADVFANFANKTFLSARDLSMGIAAVGPVARQAGMELNEFSGYMAILAQGGFRRMTDAGTSLKVSLLNLQAPSGQALQALNYIGVSAYDTTGKLRPFLDTLGSIKSAIKDLNPAQQNAVLKGIFGTDGIRAATILLGKSREEIEAIIKSQGKADEAQRVASERNESYLGSVRKLSAAWEEFRINLGEKFLPTAKAVVDTLTDLLKGGDDLQNNIKNGVGNLLPFLLPVLTVLVALKGATIGFYGAVFAAEVVGKIGAVTTALTTFAGGLSLASAGVVGLGLAAAAAWGYVIKLGVEIDTLNQKAASMNAERGKDTAERVQALAATGNAADAAKAKVLSLQEALTRAQMGEVTGQNFWGDDIRTVDEEKVQRLLTALKAAREEAVKLRPAVAETAGQIADEATDPEALQRMVDARKAAEELRAELDGKPMEIKLIGASAVEKELDTVRKAYDKLREKAAEAYKGNDPGKLKASLAEIARLQAEEEAAVRANYDEKSGDKKAKAAAAQAKKDAAALKKISEEAQKSALEVQAAEIQAMEEGQAKKQAMRDLELKKIQEETARKKAEWKADPKAQAQAIEDGRKLEAAKRAQWAREDEQQAKETADRVRDSQRTAADATIAAIADEGQRVQAQRAKDLADLEADIQARVDALKGEPEAQAAVLQDGRTRTVALQQQWINEDAATARENAKRVADSAAEARAATIAAISDEGERRKAERDEELLQLRQSTAERVEELKGFPEKQAQVEQDGRTIIEALRRQWANEDAQEAKERAQRIVKAFQEAQDAQLDAEAASREARLAQFDLALSRQVAAAGRNELAVAEIQARGARERAAREEEAARASEARERQNAKRARDEALSAENLTADERASIWTAYHAQIRELDASSHAAELGRIQQREEAERDAAENIRKLRIKAAERPLENAAAGLRALERLRELSQSTAAQLQLEGQREAKLREQEATYRDLIARAGELGLTEEERLAYGEQLADAQRDVVLSQRTQLDLARQVVTEAQEMTELFGTFGDTLSGESIPAQEAFARSTTKVGKAYQDALPWLRAWKEGRLRAEDFDPAKTSLNGLINSLKAQQDTLQDLREEYVKQRDGLKDLQQTLGSFGATLEDDNLMQAAVDYNQQSYEAAAEALRQMLAGGKFTAAELAQTVGDVEGAYKGLQDATGALTKRQVTSLDEDIKRAKTAGETSLKVLQAQIDAAKDRGEDTRELEAAKKAQEDAIDARVKALEARKQALEDEGKRQLADRTSGIGALLAQVQTAASGAAVQVDDIGTKVQAAEAQVKASAAGMRDAFGDMFSKVPSQAFQAGVDAAQAFIKGFGDPLLAVAFRAPPATVPTGQTQNFSIASLTVVSNDPLEIKRQLQRECERSGAQAAAAQGG